MGLAAAPHEYFFIVNRSSFFKVVAEITQIRLQKM